MKLLKHKHVVILREVLQSSKHIYIVLELVTGGELFDRIGMMSALHEGYMCVCVCILVFDYFSNTTHIHNTYSASQAV